MGKMVYAAFRSCCIQFVYYRCLILIRIVPIKPLERRKIEDYDSVKTHLNHIAMDYWHCIPLLILWHPYLISDPCDIYEYEDIPYDSGTMLTLCEFHFFH